MFVTRQPKVFAQDINPDGIVSGGRWILNAGFRLLAHGMLAFVEAEYSDRIPP